MSAAAMQQAPVIPARPSRSSDKDSSITSMPKVPSRPVNKRIDRSVSPNPDRFAPSPFNDGIISKNMKRNQLSPGYGFGGQSNDPIDRSGSVPLPSVGEEGMEYMAVTEELKQSDTSRPTSPEQTRTVAEDLKLHAPKPSLPAHSAKQRVAAVTRTDSDKAASYGIGRPSFEERAASRDGVKKKPSSIFSTTSDLGQHTDDEHGIPEFGQRVPMNPYLGDVQAPSPAPSADPAKKHHNRKTSGRGLPPGSYGLHGHGVLAQDTLDKAWYQKHPEQLEREQHTPFNDRQNNFAMSRAELNKLVKDTANRAVGSTAISGEVRGTPTEEVAFQASDEYTSRLASPRPASTAPNNDNQVTSPLKNCFGADAQPMMDDTIHVDDAKHPEYRSYGNEDADEAEEGYEYSAPILASDEVDPNAPMQQPAIHPERRGSADEGISRPSSRPTSRPASIHYNSSQPDFGPTPLEDVMEYEPLFPEDGKAEKEKRIKPQTEERKTRHHFPSKDIWEDAPQSVHYTAQVSTPEEPGPERRRSSSHNDRPLTPAQAFALHQEELAEKESKGLASHKGGANTFLPLSEAKPTWIAHQPHLRTERPASVQRFPSRDIWEDAPESHLHQTTITPSSKAESKPEIPTRPVKKSPEAVERPSVPDRPKPKSAPIDDAPKARPAVSDKPKPQVPARPSKSLSGDSSDGAASSKPKPPVPSRPVGGKIAALQAGFMNDLNKRLQLGPQALKKETPAEEQLADDQEKSPLVDARKSRARGPQRRAPAKVAAAPITSVDANKTSAPVLSFSSLRTVWTVDPDDDNLGVHSISEDAPQVEEKIEVTAEPEQMAESAGSQKTAEAAVPQVTEVVPASSNIEPASEETDDVSTEAQEHHEPQESQESQELPEPSEAQMANQSEEPEAVEEAKETETDLKIEDPAESEPKEKETEQPEKETKTLAANMAGESVLEATIEKKDGANEIEPLDVDDEVKS